MHKMRIGTAIWAAVEGIIGGGKGVVTGAAVGAGNPTYLPV